MFHFNVCIVIVEKFGSDSLLFLVELVDSVSVVESVWEQEVTGNSKLEVIVLEFEEASWTKRNDRLEASEENCIFFLVKENPLKNTSDGRWPEVIDIFLNTCRQ